MEWSEFGEQKEKKLQNKMVNDKKVGHVRTDAQRKVNFKVKPKLLVSVVLLPGLQCLHCVRFGNLTV